MMPLKKENLATPLQKGSRGFCRFTDKKFTGKSLQVNGVFFGRFRLKAHRFEHSHQLAAVFLGRMDTAVHVFCTLHQTQRGGRAGIGNLLAIPEGDQFVLRSRERAGRGRGWRLPL